MTYTNYTNNIIQLGECEDILKNHYNISNENSLYLFIINTSKERMRRKKKYLKYIIH